ncbi:MAG: phosphoadenylyl-sulfate reductase [Bacteroidetes bacterium]|nr:phosphoadenylyl-sulfate reductase [Bacteroidota bacterium]
MKEKVTGLQNQFKHAEPQDVLSWFATSFNGKIAFSTSLGAEDQVITFMLASLGKQVRIFTLDTGRFFQETYDLLDVTTKKYSIEIAVLFPQTSGVEAMVNDKGINLFYESVENRRLCCDLRKKEPLKRALSGMEVWITGMRQEQSVTRSGAALIEWDDRNQIIKLNPLINWTNDMVWSYIRQNHIPYNELHDCGYPSIGCSPCTRAVQPGEDIRAGRWWWELPQNKECGLHK